MENNLGIGLGPYSRFAGGGMSPEHLSLASGVDLQSVNNLLKAMEAGQLQGGSYVGQGPTGGGALKKESLESVLTILTTQQQDFKLWKRLYKAAAYNTVEEYLKKTSIGGMRSGSFSEGGLPGERNSQYKRESEQIKYIGCLNKVTDVMTMVNIATIADIVQEITEDGVTWVMRKADQYCFFGDSAIINTEFNGFYAQHLNKASNKYGVIYPTLDEYMSSDLVVDLRGRTLKAADIERANLALQKRFAQANLLLAPPSVLTDYMIQHYEKQYIRFGGQAPIASLQSGGRITEHYTQQGTRIEFDFDLYAENSIGRLYNEVPADAQAPTAPVNVSLTVVNSDTSSKFADGIGTYYYAASALNANGESALTQIGSAVATITAATDAVDLRFTDGNGNYATEAYVIYRSEVDPSGAFADTILYPIMVVPKTGSDAKRGSLAAGVDGGAAGRVRDRNRFLPNAEKCILMDYDTKKLNYKQLAPIHKHMLGVLDTSERWLTLLYGSMFLRAPEHAIIFFNCGKISDVSA